MDISKIAWDDQSLIDHCRYWSESEHCEPIQRELFRNIVKILERPALQKGDAVFIQVILGDARLNLEHFKQLPTHRRTIAVIQQQEDLEQAIELMESCISGKER